MPSLRKSRDTPQIYPKSFRSWQTDKLYFNFIQPIICPLNSMRKETYKNIGFSVTFRDWIE